MRTSKLGACKAKRKRLVWTDDMIEFVRRTAGQDSRKAYEDFHRSFKEITAMAFYKMRSNLGVAKKRPHGSNRRGRLYEERIRNGYVIIKVGEPSTWTSKARWVWEETHPGELTKRNDAFIFLNGNRRDFRPENIERVEGKYKLMFMEFGGVDSNPQITRIRLLQAKLKYAQFDLGEKIGIVINRGKSGRLMCK